MEGDKHYLTRLVKKVVPNEREKNSHFEGV